MAGVVSAAWGGAMPAAAQCALCYTSAAATGERGAVVLRIGILVLLIPTLLTFAGVLLLTLRSLKRHESWTDESRREEEEQREFLPLTASQESGAPSTP
jgi:hypothetical protein